MQSRGKAALCLSHSVLHLRPADTLGVLPGACTSEPAYYATQDVEVRGPDPFKGQSSL